MMPIMIYFERHDQGHGVAAVSTVAMLLAWIEKNAASCREVRIVMGE